MICRFNKKLLSIYTKCQHAPWADKLDGVKVEFPDDAQDMYVADCDIYGILRCWCEPITEKTKELIIERQTEPEKHKDTPIDWYDVKYGAWLKWIPKQLSIEDFGITLPEERTQPAKLKLSSLYGEMQKDDDDSLPLE